MPDGPIFVRITHQDCHYAPALQWFNHENVQKEMATLWPIVRTGYLVAENDQFVAIAMAHTSEDNEYQGIWWIPRCLIIEMIEMEPLISTTQLPTERHTFQVVPKMKDAENVTNVSGDITI